MYLTLWTSSCQKILFLIASKKIFISHNKQLFQLHLPSIQMAIFLFNVFGREIYSVVMTIKLRLLWHVQIYPILYMLTLKILSTLDIISFLLCSTPWHHPVFLKLVIVAPLSSMLQLLFKKNKRFWFLYTTNAALVYANDIKYVQDIKRGAGYWWFCSFYRRGYYCQDCWLSRHHTIWLVEVTVTVTVQWRQPTYKSIEHDNDANLEGLLFSLSPVAIELPKDWLSYRVYYRFPKDFKLGFRSIIFRNIKKLICRLVGFQLNYKQARQGNRQRVESVHFFTEST